MSNLLSRWCETKVMLTGLPWCFSGRESICQHRRPRFNPYSGKIPHKCRAIKPVLWSPGATTTEARASLRLCSTTRETTAMRSSHTATTEWSWLAATREKTAATKTQYSQKENIKQKSCLSWNTKFVFNCRELRKHTVDSEKECTSLCVLTFLSTWVQSSIEMD